MNTSRNRVVCYEDQRAPRGYDKKMIHLEKTEI